LPLRENPRVDHSDITPVGPRTCRQKTGDKIDRGRARSHSPLIGAQNPPHTVENTDQLSLIYRSPPRIINRVIAGQSARWFFRLAHNASRLGEPELGQIRNKHLKNFSNWLTKKWGGADTVSP